MKFKKAVPSALGLINDRIGMNSSVSRLSTKGDRIYSVVFTVTFQPHNIYVLEPDIL